MTLSNVTQATLLLLLFGGLRIGMCSGCSSSSHSNFLGLNDLFVIHPGIPLLLDLVLHGLMLCLGHIIVPLHRAILNLQPWRELEFGLRFGKEIARHSIAGEVKREDHHRVSLYVVDLAITEQSALWGLGLKGGVLSQTIPGTS